MLDDLHIAIVEAPDAPEPYLVYADWLQSQGDVHGEYIQLMHALEKETDSTRFLLRKKRGDALLAEHGERWLNQVKVYEPKWRWGFIRKGRVAASSLRALLDSRAGRFPRELTLTGLSSALHVAIDSVPLTVTGLRLEPTYRDEVVNLSVLPPALTRLALSPAKWELPAAMSPRLLELTLHAPADDPSLLPFLKSPNSIHMLKVADLPLAESTVIDELTYPALRRLSIASDLTDDTLEWLAKSPLLRQLESLTVGGPFTDLGLERALREFVRFSRVKELVFWGGVISKPLRVLAKKQLPQLLLLKEESGNLRLRL